MNEFKNKLISALAGGNHQELKSVVVFEEEFEGLQPGEDFLTYWNRLREKNPLIAKELFFEALKASSIIEDEDNDTGQSKEGLNRDE